MTDVEGHSSLSVSNRTGIRPFVWGLVLVGLHLVLGLLLYDPTLFTGGDNARYMVLGAALRSGEGYRDLYLPAAPLHAKYPPAFPLLLSFLGRFGDLQLFKLTSLALTSATVWAAFILGRRMRGFSAGMGAGALMAISPVLLDQSHRVLSEALFGLLVVTCLISAYGRRSLEAPAPTAQLSWLAAALAVLAFLTRTAGIALLAAFLVLILAGLLKRRAGRPAHAGRPSYVRLVGLAGVVLAAPIGWLVYQRLAAPGDPSYLGELLLSNPYEPDGGNLTPVGLALRVASNFWRYLSLELPGLFGAASGNPTTTAIGLLLGAIILVGWLGELRVSPSLATVFLPLYFGLLLAWPVVWSDARFLLPLLPLLAIYAIAGARSIADWRWPRWSAGTVLAVVLLVAAPSLVADVREMPARSECRRVWRDNQTCLTPAYAEMFVAADWARTHTSEASVIANRHPALFYLGSGRQGDVYEFSSLPEVVLAGLERMGAEYVLVDQTSITTALYLVPAIRANPDRFRLVFTTGSTSLLEFLYGTQVRGPVSDGTDPRAGLGSGARR